MEGILVYQFTINVTHEKYPPDTVVYYGAANSYEEAEKDARESHEHGGWKIQSMVERQITVWDHRKK